MGLRNITAVLFILLLGFSIAYSQAPSAPYGVAFSPTVSEYTVVWYYTGVNCQSYSNDRGEERYFYLVNAPGGSGRVIVEYPDVNTGYPIDSISICLWRVDPFSADPGDCHSPFELAIFGQLPANASEAPTWGPYEVFSETEGGWVQVPVHKKLDSTGKLFAQFRWLPGFPTAPLPVLDGSINDFHTFNADLSQNPIIWRPEFNGNLLMRLTYNLPDTLESFRHPLNTPDSFAVFLADDSSAAATISSAYAVVGNSLHLPIQRSVGNGKYVAIAAWSDNHISARSTPLYLDPQALLPFPFQIVPESLTVTSKAGKTSSQEIMATNWTDQSIYLNLRPVMKSGSDWLQCDTTRTLIESGGSYHISLTCDNSSLQEGDYWSELVMHCDNQSCFFRDRTFRIKNHVESETATENEPITAKFDYDLTQNFPNPFNSGTVIQSTVPSTILIYDLIGRTIRTLQPFRREANGEIVFLWDGNDAAGIPVASGVYFYKQVGSQLTRKMLLLK